MDTLCQEWNSAGMHDLEDLRIFERVAALKSFSLAARSLSRPKSTISRSVARLEASLGTRLIQRTTREVALTPAGEAMVARCSSALSELSDAIDYVGSLSETPQGLLRISCGVGWGFHVLAGQLPEFVKLFPLIDLQLDLTGRLVDLVQERVDVAVRMGPIPDSTIVAVRLGSMSRLLCASPGYLKARTIPRVPDDLAAHDFIEMPGQDGRPRVLTFQRNGQTTEISIRPRIEVNEALTIHRLVKGGAGIGVISNYLCVPDIAGGRLVQLLPDWSPQPVDISLIFPSKRELAPAVRAFVEFMKKVNGPRAIWRDRDLSVDSADE
jgi:LysR family transcriptional regulator, regulator for bpeEF and oprC